MRIPVKLDAGNDMTANPGEGATRRGPRRWSFGPAEFDEASFELTVRGQPVEIERKPLEVLRQLLDRPGDMVSKEDLLGSVWPGRIVSESVLAKCVSRIREVLGDDEQSLIKTVHGYGYRLAAAVRGSASGAAAGKPLLRLLLVEDHELFRDGIKLLLADLAERVAFAEASTCAAALALAETDRFDVVLLDYHLPGMHGLDALRALRAALREATIVVLSAEEDPSTIRRVVEEGAAGFIPKASSHAVMLAALRLILAGGTYLPPNALLAAPAAPSGRHAAGIEALSEGQLTLLRLALQGKSGEVIARETGLADADVVEELARCYQALGVRTRADAVFAAAKAGLKP